MKSVHIPVSHPYDVCIGSGILPQLGTKLAALHKICTVAVISDGSAVLGLGNIGPYAAMPVMEGKAVLFKEFGGVNAVPICLDTQDTEEIIKTIT